VEVDLILGDFTVFSIIIYKDDGAKIMSTIEKFEVNKSLESSF
jgi:hypothetical protein